MELTHECWVLVASFLRFDERRTLMELNSAVADSPVRRRFFEDSVLRMPLREREIEKLLSIMKMERYVKRMVVKQAWHLFYIRNFPELEEIFVNRKKKMEGGSLATSCEIPYTCRKKLRVDTQHLPLGALMNICTDTTEEIDLRVNKLQGSPRALPGVKTLRMRSSWKQTFDWSDKVPNLRVLRLERTGFHKSLMDPLKHLEVLELVQCTSPSLEALMPIAPQLRRLELFDVSIQVRHPAKDAMNAFVTSLVKIEELSIVGPSAFSYSDPKLISMLTTLKKLDLRHQSLADLTPLSTLTELEELRLLEPKLNLDWSPISSLKKLRSFWMSEGIFCTKSKNFASAIHSLPQLKTLCYPWRLTAQYPLHHLRSLVLSAFPGEWKYRKLEVGCWPNLRELELKGKVDLQSVVASFPNLTKLLLTKLKYCPDFRPIAPLTYIRRQVALWVQPLWPGKRD